VVLNADGSWAWFETILGEQGSLTLLKDSSLVDTIIKNNIDVVVRPIQQKNFLKNFVMPLILPIAFMRFLNSNISVEVVEVDSDGEIIEADSD